MKKEVVVTVRVDAEINEIIRTLAKADDRTVAWVARKLITEALEARNLLKRDERSSGKA
jgi:predicted transcriptional regulator